MSADESFESFREALLRHYFPPPRQESSFQIKVDVEAGRPGADGDLETMQVTMTTGEQPAPPDDWQVIGAVEAAWQVAAGLGYPLRVGDLSSVIKNLSEDELRSW